MREVAYQDLQRPLFSAKRQPTRKMVNMPTYTPKAKEHLAVQAYKLQTQEPFHCVVVGTRLAPQNMHGTVDRARFRYDGTHGTVAIARLLAAETRASPHVAKKHGTAAGGGNAWEKYVMRHCGVGENFGTAGTCWNPRLAGLPHARQGPTPKARAVSTSPTSRTQIDSP